MHYTWKIIEKQRFQTINFSYPFYRISILYHRSISEIQIYRCNRCCYPLISLFYFVLVGNLFCTRLKIRKLTPPPSDPRVARGPLVTHHWLRFTSCREEVWSYADVSAEAEGIGIKVRSSSISGTVSTTETSFSISGTSSIVGAHV